eukprot:jgi/Tetstr1/422712/TSEL_013509.t1
MSQLVAQMRTIAHDAAATATRAVMQELSQPSLSPKPDPGDSAHHAATSAPAPALVPAPMPPPLSLGSLGDDLGALPVAPSRQLGAHDLGRSLKTALSQFSTTDSWPIYRDDFLAHRTTVNPVLVAVLLGARPPAHGLTAESFSLLRQQLSATLTVVMKSHPTAATRLRNLRRSDAFAAADNPGTLAWDQMCTHLDRRGVACTVRHLLALQQPQSPSEDQGGFTRRMLNAYHELNDSPVSLHSNVLHENVLVVATLAGMHNTVARDTILSALDAAETRAEDISYGRLCDMMHRHPTAPDSKPTRTGQDVAAFAAAMHTQMHLQYPPASRIPVPDTIKQALAGKYHKEWRASIVSELRSLRARNTFAYARLPIDIETAFLNASLKEEIYMRQPKGAEDGTDNVLRLLKSIYGLKQASREWYELIHKTLTGLGLARSNSDTSMYSMNHPRYGICIVLVYVDDILVVSDSIEWIWSAKSAIGAEFNMTDFGEAAFVMGMDLTRCWASGTIRLSQEQYTLELLEKYGMHDCSPPRPPWVVATTKILPAPATPTRPRSPARTMKHNGIMIITVIAPNIAGIGIDT